jgi:hypothetical protein
MEVKASSALVFFGVSASEASGFSVPSALLILSIP